MYYIYNTVADPLSRAETVRVQIDYEGRTRSQRIDTEVQHLLHDLALDWNSRKFWAQPSKFIVTLSPKEVGN